MVLVIDFGGPKDIRSVAVDRQFLTFLQRVDLEYLFSTDGRLYVDEFKPLNSHLGCKFKFKSDCSIPCVGFHSKHGSLLCLKPVFRVYVKG